MVRRERPNNKSQEEIASFRLPCDSAPSNHEKLIEYETDSNNNSVIISHHLQQCVSLPSGKDCTATNNSSRLKQWSYVPSYVRVLSEQKGDCVQESSRKVTLKRTSVRRNTVTFGTTTNLDKSNYGLHKSRGNLIQLRDKNRCYTEPEICVKQAVAQMEARITPSNNQPKPPKPVIRAKPAALQKHPPKPAIKPKAPLNGCTRNTKLRRSISDPNLEKKFNQVKKLWDKKVELEKHYPGTENESNRTDSVSSLSSVESSSSLDRKRLNSQNDYMPRSNNSPTILIVPPLANSSEPPSKKQPLIPPRPGPKKAVRSRASSSNKLPIETPPESPSWQKTTSPTLKSSSNENLSVSQKAMLFGGAKKYPSPPLVETRRNPGARSPAFQRYRRSLSDEAMSPSSDSEKRSLNDAHIYDEVPYTRQHNNSDVTSAKEYTDRRDEDKKQTFNNLQKNAYLAKERRNRKDVDEAPLIPSDDEVRIRKGGFLNEVRRRSDKEKKSTPPKDVSSTPSQAVKKTEETIFGPTTTQVDASRRIAEEAEFKGRRRASSLHKLMEQQYHPSSTVQRSMTPGNSPLLNRAMEANRLIENNNPNTSGVLRPKHLPLQGRERSSTEGSLKKKVPNDENGVSGVNNFAQHSSTNLADNYSAITPDEHSNDATENESLTSSNSSDQTAVQESPSKDGKPTVCPLSESVLEKRRLSKTMSSASVESGSSQNTCAPSLNQDFNPREVYDEIAKQMSEDDNPESPGFDSRPVSGDGFSESIDSTSRTSLEVPSNRSSTRGGYSADFWSDFEEDDEIDSVPSSPCKALPDTPRVPSPSLSVKETTEVKLHNIAKELLSTEESYVAVLYLIDKVFHKQVLDAAVQKHIMPEAVVNNIFCHVPAIYQFHSSFLLPQLQERLQHWETNPRIGDIMTQAAPFLKMYSLYVQHFDEAMNTIKQWSEKSSGFSAIIKAIQKTPECNSLSLQHHMLSPVQRVPRYRLLLADYLKRLPEDADDRQEAETALKLISVAATHSNETMKKIEKFHKLVNIFNGLADVNFDIVDVTRELLKEGKIIKISARNGEKHERYLYLFSDMLLCCAPLRRLQGKAYRVTAKIDLDGMKIAAVKHATVSHTFCVNGLQKSMEFAANTHEDKTNWVQAVQEAIVEREDRLKTFKSKIGEQSTSEDPLSPVNEQVNGSPMHPLSPSHRKPPADEIADADLGSRAPRWIKDHEVTMCMGCQKPFNKLLRRRHHCRACGKVVCSECSDNKTTLHYDPGKPMKVCARCYNILTGRHRHDSTDCEKKGVLEVEADAVSEDSVIADYLFVSESEKKKTWTKTWCVIPNNELCLYFYGAHQDVRAQMTMPLPGFEVTHVISNEHKYCIKLKQARKVFIFGSNDSACIERWKYALGQASIGEDLFRDDVYRLGEAVELPDSSSEESESQPEDAEVEEEQDNIQQTDDLQRNESASFADDDDTEKFV